MSPPATGVWDRFGDLISILLSRHEAPSLPAGEEYLSRVDDLRRYPAALLAVLAGPGHPRYGDAIEILRTAGDSVGSFVAAAPDRIQTELESVAADCPAVSEAMARAVGVNTASLTAARFDRVWGLFFPEGVGLLTSWDAAVTRLRDRRRVTITELSDAPIVDPVREVLFTSNVLVSPGDSTLPPDQSYDHPIPLTIADYGGGELAHGLRELDRAVGFELDRHPEWQGPATLVLSVAATHDGFEEQGRMLVKRTLATMGPLPNLFVFTFTEGVTRQLWDAVTVATRPGKYRTGPPVFGVSGPYGRHYSFLKAVAALWSVCVDTGVRATFKIDLDQSFPQQLLLDQTGQTAFEHLTTSRWGARGVASTGETLDFVLIAGGLVNEPDATKSVFTPDVDLNPVESSAEHTVFFSQLPQVLSTQAEIVSRYDAPAMDGERYAQERIHVTGGTNGILVAGLRRWRLFTPSVFGRAEDQAYLVSGLGGSSRPAYIHEPGLVMSHDKARLIPKVIEKSSRSNHIGDLVRTRLFSKYVAPEWKQLLDPFTGCFASLLPVTVTTLRLAVGALDPALAAADAEDYLEEGVRRLRNVDQTVVTLDDTVAAERCEWNHFYDSLDAIESGLAVGEKWAVDVRTTVQRIVAGLTGSHRGL